MADAEPIIGIDLGTTNSAVATVQGSQAVIIPNRQGQNLTPSFVALTASGKSLVGSLAKRQRETNPQDTIYAAKRLIGRRFSSEGVQKALSEFPYKIEAGEHDDIRIKLGQSLLSVPEISSRVLHELKLDAEAYFNRPVKKAVVTVPAYFNDGQRQATKDAGLIAGLDVMRIINEPTAAALAYGFGKNISGKICIFDMGGGTFDVSVLDVSNGVFDVRATGGDTYLGGEDFDNRIIDWMCFSFAKEHGIDLRADKMALQRLKEAAEKAKIELSTTKEAHINLAFIATPQNGGAALHLQATLTRDKLFEITKDLIEKSITICEQVLAEAKVKTQDLKEMILVGGMTRMPKVVEAVKKYFKRDPCKGVHPDEVVALGAAVQAAALGPQTNAGKVLLLDVTPQSLGVAIAGGYVRRLIPKNTTVPTSMTEAFNTSRDHQTNVKIIVLQGEEDLAHKNEMLGEFTLTELRSAKRGEVEIDVTFEINSEGLVSVSATDKDTGKAQSIQTATTSGLTQDELKKIIEQQGDYFLEAKADEELRSKRKLLEEAVAETSQLVEQARSVDGGEALLEKSDQVLESAKQALKGKSLAEVASAGDVVGRTLQSLKGLLQRVGR